jgi:hypothetical protein
MLKGPWGGQKTMLKQKTHSCDGVPMLNSIQPLSIHLNPMVDPILTKKIIIATRSSVVVLARHSRAHQKQAFTLGCEPLSNARARRSSLTRRWPSTSERRPSGATARPATRWRRLRPAAGRRHASRDSWPPCAWRSRGQLSRQQTSATRRRSVRSAWRVIVYTSQRTY